MYALTLTGEVSSFIQSLEKPTIAKVLRSIDLLEEFGFQLTFPHTKKIDRDLFELRIRGSQEIRIFYTFRNKRIYLIHGFIKKSQRTPLREIEKTQKIVKQIN